jgi:hypothetical protein
MKQFFIGKFDQGKVTFILVKIRAFSSRFLTFSSARNNDTTHTQRAHRQALLSWFTIYTSIAWYGFPLYQAHKHNKTGSVSSS